MRVELDMTGDGHRREHVHAVKLLPGLVIHRNIDRPRRGAEQYYTVTHRGSGMGVGVRLACPRNRPLIGELRKLLAGAGVDWTLPVGEILSTRWPGWNSVVVGRWKAILERTLAPGRC